MLFMLLIHDEPGAYDDLSAADRAALYAEYGALNRDLGRALVASHQLRAPGVARTVRVEDGRRVVTDGGIAATGVILGGYYLIDVPSMDEAVEWAARIPSARFGPIEVRPVLAE